MTTAIAANGFIAALFVLCGLGVVVQRQMLSTFWLFVLQALALTASAALLGTTLGSPDLFWVAGIEFATKAVAVPLVLLWATKREVYTRREVDQVLTIPRTILIAGALALVAWIVAHPLAQAITDRPFAAINLPSGMIAMFFGALTVAVRREAVVQLMGILIMDSGAFFASIAIVNNLSIIAEVVAAVDVPIAALVIGLLIHSIRRATGSTRVGLMAELKEHR